MEWNKLALWFLFIGIMSVVVCVTIFTSLDSPNQTEIEREVMACDWACPYEDGHCIIECVKALNIERNQGAVNHGKALG